MRFMYPAAAVLFGINRRIKKKVLDIVGLRGDQNMELSAPDVSMI